VAYALRKRSGSRLLSRRTAHLRSSFRTNTEPGTEYGGSLVVKNLTRTMTTYMLDMFKGLGKRKPSRRELRARIAALLAESPPAESRRSLHEEAGQLIGYLGS